MEESNSNNDNDKSVSYQNDKDLNSKWIFWHASRKEEKHHIKYSDRLVKLSGSINKLSQFFCTYSYINTIENIDRNNDISLFKEGYKPAWEFCPNSACLFIRFRKTDDPRVIDVYWEKLLISIIGEHFSTAHILGVILSLRGRETIIELWFNYFKNDDLKIKLVTKFKQLLNFEDESLVYFKDNEDSLKDYSTLRNAEIYTFAKKYC